MRRGPALLALLVACGPGRGAPAPAPVVTPRPVVTAPPVPVAPASPRRGVPHFGAIVATAVSLDGAVAVSRDSHGDLRLWPALDGRAEPQRIDVEGATQLRVQASADDVLVGAVTVAGLGVLVRYRRDGALRGSTTLPADGPAVLALVPLADAGGAIVLRADQQLAWVDAAGVEQARLARPATRFVALEADAAGPVALVRTAQDGTVRHTLARVTAAAGRLTLTGEVALARPPREPAVLAIAPGGARMAYLVDPGQVAIVDAATGREQAPADVASLAVADALQLGFTTPERLHVLTPSTDWTIDLDAGRVTAGAVGHTAVPSIAPGRIVAGVGHALTVLAPDGELRFLDYAALAPAAGALSPDGAQVAWATGDGTIVVEAIAAGGPARIGPRLDGGVGLLRFVDDRHLLAVDQRGLAHLLDATTGAERASLAIGGAPAQLAFDPGRRWLAGPHPSGGAWLVAIDPAAAAPFTRLHVVPDGSSQVAFTDDDARALVTLTGGRLARRYAVAELRAGVTPGAIAARAAEALTDRADAIDGAGRRYAIAGEALRIVDAGDPARVLATAPIAPDARALVPSPAGDQVLVVSQSRALTAIGLDGRLRWYAAAGVDVVSASFSADGRRVVVIAGDGGLVLDAATGEVVATGCGWRFGASASPPGGFALPQKPVCR